MILSVPVTAATNPGGRQEWDRRVADAVNQLIARKAQPKSVTSDYTVENDYDVLEIDTTSGNITISLPAASLHKGRLLYVKRMTAGANTLTVDGNGAETIDGAATLSLSSQYEASGLYSDGSNWIRVIYTPGGGGTTTNSLTINNSGAGAASGATFNGSAAVTISYNTVGAAASSHTHAQADVTGLTTADSPQFAGINIGHASDTTLTRTGAGDIAVEGNAVYRAGGTDIPVADGGTGASTAAGARTNLGLVIGTDVLGMGGGTLTGDLSVPDEAYGSGWNGSVEVPTKNAVYDKIEAVTGRQWALVGTGQTATGVWDQAVDGSKANVDFTGLSGYTDILLVAVGVTKSVSGTLNGAVSVDNGATFFTTSGDYVIVAADGTVSNSTAFVFHGTSATAARSGMVRMPGVNVGVPARIMEQLNNPTLSRMFVASSSAINAVRMFGGGGGNLTGGKIYCYAR